MHKKRRKIMQENISLSTHEPTIRTQNNASDTPVPLNQNEAKKKLKSFLSDFFSLNITTNHILYNDLLIIFDHEKGKSYYLKEHLRKDIDILKQTLTDRKLELSFL